MIKTEKDVQRDIKEKLRWEPMLRESDITVRVEDNVIVLEGTVNTLMKKNRAEEVAKDVAGLSSIENKIEIARTGVDAREDKMLEHEIKEEIRRNTDVNRNWIRVSVHEGWVTLEGTVQHAEQSDKIRQVVADVEGVMGVANLIKIAKHEEESPMLENLEREDRRDTELEREMKKKTRDRFQETGRKEKKKIYNRLVTDEDRRNERNADERRREFRNERRNEFQRLVYNVTRKIMQANSFIDGARNRMKDLRAETPERQK